MSEKSKSISSKKDFNKDERLKKVSNLKVLLNSYFYVVEWIKI